jgi:hypothetical protein
MKLFDIKGEIMERAVAEQISYEVLRRANIMVEGIAKAAYSNIVGFAQRDLGPKRAQQYVNAMSFDKVQDGYIIKLAAKARWIEEGLQPGPMLPKLAQGPASQPYKQGGGSYVVIPLDQGTTRVSKMAPQKVQDMAKTLRAVLKDAKIGTAISKKRDGEPKIGKIADIRGVTKGPVSKRGIPLLEGLRVEQVKRGSGAQRKYTTFRVASTRQDPSEYWYRHKEVPGLKAFERIEDFIKNSLSEIVKEVFSG